MEVSSIQGYVVYTCVCVCACADQLIFVKEGYERVRDDLVKSLHETFDLSTDGLRHPHLCHQLNILLL